MGFWQGLNAGLTEVMAQKERQRALEAEQAEAEKERAFRREMFQKEVLEKYRMATLELATKRQEQDAALRQKVEYGVSIGLSETTAVALLQSNQLDLFLAQYEKNQKVDPKFVADLNMFVETKLQDAGPETISGAMIAGVSTPRDVQDPEESQMAIIESVLTASSPEQLDSLYTQLLSGGPSITPLPRFSVDFTTMAGPTSEETKAIRRELAEGAGGYFKDSFTITDNGDVIVNQNAPSEVLTVFNEAERKAREMAFGPTRQFTPTDAANFVSTRLETVVRGAQGTVDPLDIAKNFDTILMDPNEYLKMVPVPAPEPVEIVTPEEFTDSLMSPTGDPWRFDLNTMTPRQ